MSRLGAPLLLCLSVGLAPPCRADRLAELGVFERESVEAALTELGLEVDNAPDGKRLGLVRVKNFEVFGEKDSSFLRWFNLFHRTTTEETIAREVLLRPGDRWDQERVDETVRNLQSPVYSNVIVAVPTRSAERDTVDLLIVTRDVWSLRFNSNIQFQGDSITLLSFSLAENNFLGWRKQMNVFFNMDQGAFEVGPAYVDPNILGTHLTLDSRASVIFGRDTLEAEGTRSATTLEYPLWSLDQTLGGSVNVTHYDSLVRSYQGSGVRTYDAPGTLGDDAIPWAYRYTYVEGSAKAKAAFGRGLKHLVSAGYEAYWLEASLPDDFAYTGVARRQFEYVALPRGELSSALTASYELYTPKYATYRDFATYDLREDYLVGPYFGYFVTQGLRALGSDDTYTRVATTLQVADSVGGAYLKASASWSARLEVGSLRDHRSTLSFYGATPSLFSALRVVVRSDLSAWLSGENVGTYALGGDSGLRGHSVGALNGSRRFRTNVELRSIPWRVWALRVGGVVFWDFGDAVNDLSDLAPVHDVGLGLRILIPQFNTYVFRLDWAFATEGVEAGWPGRLSFGFLQAF